MTEDETLVRPEIVDALRKQVPTCRDAGSEFTARLLECCVADIEAGGPVAVLLSDWQGHPLLDALPQRLVGAVQLRVLEGAAPELARHYPCLGGTPEWPAAADAFIAVVASQRETLRPYLDHQVQTNEVRRCATLLGGFLEIARASSLPLRLREVGSSAGFHLFWDRYRYELGSHHWGDPGSAVVLDTDWRGAPPALDAKFEIASRLGCDLSPLDVTNPDALRRIESFLWADQTDRHRLLRAAAASLGGTAAPLEACSARPFVERELATPVSGQTTVLFHSHMWWYLSRDDRHAVAGAIEAAGERARADAPLAWMRCEAPNMDCVELRLRTWPGDEERLLARAHHHGRWVEWLG